MSDVIPATIKGQPLKWYIEVAEERIRQNKKWGEQNHAPDFWMSILGEEYGEVCKEVQRMRFNGKSPDDFCKELVQTAAVCVAILECVDRDKDSMNNFLNYFTRSNRSTNMLKGIKK